MKTSNKFFMVMVFVLSISLLFSGVSFAKAKHAKVNLAEVQTLVEKFKAAYPAALLPPGQIPAEAADKCKAFPKLTRELKHWDALVTRSTNDKLSPKKREKAKLSAEKLAAKINTMLEEHAKTCKACCGAKCEAQTVPGEYQPRTEKGRQVMELLKNKK